MKGMNWKETKVTNLDEMDRRHAKHRKNIVETESTKEKQMEKTLGGICPKLDELKV